MNKPPFTTVVELYLPMVYCFAKRQIDHAYLDDVVQETFMLACKAYDSFAFYSEGQLKSWLLRICKNNIINIWKKPTTLLLEEDNVATDENVENSVLTKIESEKIWSVIRTLPADTQSFFQLRIVENLSFPEIGIIFNCTEDAAKMRYYRALNYIREFISC